MAIAGRVVYNDEMFFLVCNTTVRKDTWFLLSPIHKEDRYRIATGGQSLFPRIITANEITSDKLNENYVLEALEVNKQVIDKRYYGRLRLLPTIISQIDNAKDYVFKKDDIYQDETYFDKGKKTSVRIASDRNLRIDIQIEDNKYKKLHLLTSVLNMELDEVRNSSFRTNLVFDDMNEEQLHINKLHTLYTLNMKDLRSLLDLSWYEKPNGQKLKDYGSVKSIPQFEKEVIDEIVKEYHVQRKLGKELVLSIDTETTGLNIYYLKDSNPQKDFIVATPISWRDNQARVIFNDMEYFDNVPKEYMFSRLKELVESNEGINLKLNGETTSMDVFEDHINLTKEDYMLERKYINLVGHNVMYDGRVFYDNGVRPYWNNDTLQMAFNLNPKVGKNNITTVEYDEIETENGIEKINPRLVTIKGGVGLKNLTRRFFGHETPELSDLLGKGNEGRYRDIRDEEVAILYGCADADYTRLVFKKLRELMPDHMYKMYRKQDVPMLNILYVSEYYGLLANEENVIKMADNAEANLKIMHNFLETYVGRIIDRLNKTYPLKVKHRLGELTDKEYEKALNNIVISENAKYTFDMKPANIRKVLYDILQYPVMAYTEPKDGKPGQAKVDKYCMKKLMSYKSKHETLAEDILGIDGHTVLIEKDKFNSLKYPVAYVLSRYAVLNKEYTSYFKPIRDGNMEGRIFKGYSLSRIETRRIMNPSQTMKSELKDNILSFDGGKDWYMVDFDMAQVEYRIMISLASSYLGIMFPQFKGKSVADLTDEEITTLTDEEVTIINNTLSMINRLKDPEKDFHTESAAMLKGIKPHLVDKKFRKQMKAVHFGIPYGLGDNSLCETMFGTKRGEPNYENDIYETIKLKQAFSNKNGGVIAMLEHYRDEALKPREFSYEFKKFAGFVEGIKHEDGRIEEVVKPVGWVRNLLGFYRLFDLSNLDKKQIGIIRRAAGNFPIQSFAAELFRMILIRFYNRCVKEGVEDKIVWHMLIHDELLLSAHKSIHPFFLYKMIKEECMITFKGHTKYFVGIGIGDTWGDAKSDKYEAPVLFVNRMIKRWDAGEFKNETWIDNPKDYVMGYMNQFFKERIHEVLKQLLPNMDTEPINLQYIFDHMENYTVRAYLTDSFVPEKFSTEAKNKKLWKDLSDEARLREALAEWALEEFGENKELIDYNGSLITVGQIINASVDELKDFKDDTNDFEFELEREDDEYWSFSDDEDMDEYIEELYFTEYEDDGSDEYGMKYDLNNPNAKSVADLIVSKPAEYENIKKLKNQIVILLPRTNKIPKIKSYLIKYQDTKGVPVLFKLPGNRHERWTRISKKVDLNELDNYIKEVIS